MGYLVSESKFLIVDSLQSFVKHLINGGTSLDAGGGGGAAGGDGMSGVGSVGPEDGLEMPLSASEAGAARFNRDNPALFFQEMLVRITLQVPCRI